MRRKNKNRIYRFLRKFSEKGQYTYALVTIIIIIIASAMYFFRAYKNSIAYTFTINILATLFAALIVYIFCFNFFKKILEDSDKLSEDYAKLCEIYSKDNLMKYTQKCVSKRNLKLAKKHTNNVSNCTYGAEIKSPLIPEYIIIDENILLFEFESDKKYKPPIFSIENHNFLFSAHSQSTKYNNKLYRVNHIDKDKNFIKVYLGETQYFYSLITNRAMDFRINGNINLRKLFVLDNSVGSLSDSKLSNHLGFNAVVETIDEKIVFVKRSKNLSVEKDNLGLGVQASFKYKYIKEAKDIKDGIYNAIKKEAKDELNIDNNNIDKCKIIYIYRNLVEGGKPQLLIYIKLNITSEQVYMKFNTLVEYKHENPNLTRDGDYIYFLNTADFDSNFICILPDGISGRFLNYKYNDNSRISFENKFRWFDMVPSSASSLILWQSWKDQVNYC